MELLLLLMDILLYLLMNLNILQIESFKLFLFLHNFISVDILFSNAVFSLTFCLVVNNNSWGKLFPSNILIFIVKIATVWFLTGDFSLFNCESDNLTFTLLYSTTSIFTKILWILKYWKTERFYSQYSQRSDSSVDVLNLIYLLGLHLSSASRLMMNFYPFFINTSKHMMLYLVDL